MSCAYIFFAGGIWKRIGHLERNLQRPDRAPTDRKQYFPNDRRKSANTYNNTPFPFLLFPKPPFCFIKVGSEEEEEPGNSLLPSFPPPAIGPAIKPNQGPIQPFLSLSSGISRATLSSPIGQKREEKKERPEAALFFLQHHFRIPEKKVSERINKENGHNCINKLWEVRGVYFFFVTLETEKTMSKL